MKSRHLSRACLALAAALLPHALAAQVTLQTEHVLVQPAQVIQQVAVLRLPSIDAEQRDCLPLGANGVLNAVVTNEPVAARVRMNFRRVNSDKQDFYYVHARPRGDGKYAALLPRPDASESGSRSSSRSGTSQLERMAAELRQSIAAARARPTAESRRLAETAARRLALIERRMTSGLAPDYEAVVYFAELLDVNGNVLARSEERKAKVIEDCQADNYFPRGEDQNLVLGETAQWQGEGEPFHWECTGIVTRIDFLGQLWPDGYCRDYLVSRERPLNVLRSVSLQLRDGYETVTVFYGTDRAPSGSQVAADFYGTARGQLELGKVEVSIPAGHQIGALESEGIFEGPDPRQHVLVVSIDVATRSGFVQELGSLVAASQERDAFVFIHGYNVSFRDAARRTAQIAYDMGFGGVPLMYSWPSQAELKGYPVDEANIRWTVPHLQEFLDLVIEESGAESIHLISHSMGNRAVTEVLRRYAAERQATEAGVEPRFDQVVLVAPDVDADVFRDEIAPGIQSEALRVTLYASENDKALKVSKGVHGHPRAGDLSSGVVIAGGVDTVDASDTDTGVFQAVSLGHSYFAEEFAVLTDLKAILEGKTPSQRSLTAFSIGAGLYWKF